LQLDVAPPAEPEPRLPVHPDQIEFVTGVDQVRVVYLGVDIPQLGPEPGLLQIHARYSPEGIALLYYVGFRNIVIQRDRRMKPTTEE
jgi:hypothetical protein